MPALSSEKMAQVAAGETVSDSFYFVENKLVMHNKAYYTYVS